MQPQVMMVPAQMQYGTAMGPVVTMPTTNYAVLPALAALPGLYIRQQISIVEALTGYDTQNKYHIFPWDPVRGDVEPGAGKADDTVFKAAEKSNCFIRQMCGGRRPFVMSVFPFSERLPKSGADPFQLPESLTLERPFKCTILCFNRPIIRVRHNQLGYLAEVVNKFTLLNWIYEVRSPTPEATESTGVGVAQSVANQAPGTLWYRVRGEACQPGMWCRLPCGPCKRISFFIYAADDVNFKNPLGEFRRIWRNCCTEMMMPQVDTYVLSFPHGATPEQKAGLLGCAMLCDFLQFEHKPDNKNNSVVDAAFSS